MLSFRAARGDDVFTPLGRSSERPVADFLARQGVPAAVRRGVRVATRADGRVAWVVGHRIDAAFAVRQATSRVALLEASTNAGPAPVGRSSSDADRSLADADEA
jgi:hypothetical protein